MWLTSAWAANMSPPSHTAAGAFSPSPRVKSPSARVQRRVQTVCAALTAQSAALVQKQLASAKTAADVVAAVSGAGASKLDTIHCVTAVHRIALLTTTRAQRSEAKLSAALGAVLTALSPMAAVAKLNAQGVSNLTWALARLAADVAVPVPLLERIHTHAKRPAVWVDATPQALANTALAHGQLVSKGFVAADTGVMLVLADAALPRLEAFKATELCQFLWAMAVTHTQPQAPGWPAAAWDVVVQKLPQLNATELSLIVWSMGSLKAGPVDKAALAAVEARLAQRAPECDAQAVSNALLGLSRLDGGSKTTVEALLARLQVLLPNVQSAQALCLALVACAKLFGRSTGGAEASIGEIVTRILSLHTELTMEDVAQMCDALSSMGVGMDAKATEFVAQSLLMERLDTATALQLDTICRALRAFEYVPPADGELRARLMERCNQLDPSAAADATPPSKKVSSRMRHLLALVA